jgi:RNA polymerase sigma-70 factor (ECF subfamily)
MNYARDDARDVLSQTIFEAYSGFEKLQNRQAFLSYLFTIARRVNTKLVRERRRKVEIDPDYFDSLCAYSSDYDRSDVAELYTAMAKLPEEQKEALTLCEIMGLTREETAQIQSVSSDTVQKRIWRARLKLRELLEDDKSPEGNTTPLAKEHNVLNLLDGLR